MNIILQNITVAFIYPRLGFDDVVDCYLMLHFYGLVPCESMSIPRILKEELHPSYIPGLNKVK